MVWLVWGECQEGVLVLKLVLVLAFRSISLRRPCGPAALLQLVDWWFGNGCLGAMHPIGEWVGGWVLLFDGSGSLRRSCGPPQEPPYVEPDCVPASSNNKLALA